MSENLMLQSCERFASALASKQAVPGGGGAAAYTGALAAALCSMVGNFTTGKKTYAAVEADVQRMLKEAQAARFRLVSLVQEDADAFEPLAAAYAIPRDDPSRAETLEEVTKWACAAPLEMMREICHVIELLEEMGEKGSRMLLSDVGCGAYLAAAALQSAALNVFVNTRTLQNRVFAEFTEADVDSMLNEYLPRAQACAAAVNEKLRG